LHLAHAASGRLFKKQVSKGVIMANLSPEMGGTPEQQLNIQDSATQAESRRNALLRTRAFTTLRRLAVVTCIAFSGSVASAEASDTYNSTENWAGYEIDTMPDYVDGMLADWIEPSLTCPSSGTQNADIWVGLGTGSVSDPLYQTGVKLDCSDGTGTVKAFWEEYPEISPEQSFEYNHTISPGDKMVASMHPNSNGMELDLQDYGSDLSQPYANWTSQEQIWETTPSSFGSGECIVERDTVDSGFSDFANVGTVQFSTDTSGSFAKACDILANDNDHIISSSGTTLSGIKRDEMWGSINPDADLLASTTGQSTSGSFQVEWQGSS
jgi:hypothetical protein